MNDSGVNDSGVNDVRGAYNALAGSYAEALPDESFEADIDRAFIGFLAASLAPASDARLLDAGCGAGRMITMLRARTDVTIEGVDLSPVMIELARLAHPELRFTEGQLAFLPFEDARFIAVFSWYSIIHTPPDDLAQIFVEFHRVLQPGGMLLLGFHAGMGVYEIQRPYGHDVLLAVFLHDPGDVEESLIRAGLEPQSELNRAPRSNERHRQGFILARKP